MANSKFESSVDEILKTVQQRQAAQAPSNDAAVDDILAGLGLGDSLYGTLRRPAAEQGTVPAAPKPAAQPSAAPVSPKPAAAPKPTAEPNTALPGQNEARPEQKPAPAAEPDRDPPAKPAEQTPAPKPGRRLIQKTGPAPKPAVRSSSTGPDAAPQRAASSPAPEKVPEPAEKRPGPAVAEKPGAAPEKRPGPAATEKPDTAPEKRPGPAATEKPNAAEKPAIAKKPGAAPEPSQKKTEPAAPPPEKPAPPPEKPAAPEPAPAGGAKALPEEENEPTREFAPVPGGFPRVKAEAPSAPAGQEGPTPPDTGSMARAIQESVEKGPSVRPLETKTGVLHLNEIVDEEFTKFFSETVAVVPDEEKEEEPGGLFRRKRRRVRPAGPPEEETLRPDGPEGGMTGEVRLDRDEPLELAELDGPPEEEAPPPRRRFVLPRFLGVEEPEEDGPFGEEEPEEYLDDYADRQDAPSVQADLVRMCASLRLRSILTGLVFVLLLYLGLCAGGLLPAIPSIDPIVAPAAYLGVSLLLLVIAAAVSFQTMRAGLAGLFGAPSPDSMPTLAVLAAAAQLIVCLLKPEGWLPAETTLFAAPAVLLLCLNAVGKRMMGGVVERNFELVSSGIDHVAAYRLRDKKLAEKAAAGLAEPEPSLLVNRPTALVKGFLHQSFSERWSDRLAQRLCWGLTVCAVLAAVIAAAKGGGAQGAVTVLAGALCLGGPLSCTLLSALPSLLMQQSACRVGAVVPGWSAVQEMSRANVVVVGARDLFPSASVVLHGIKTFEKERIDLAILYAASVLIEGCDTLRDVFLSIIQNKTEMLYPVENLTHEVGGGFIAWVEHNRVILGGRAMMQGHDIDIPSMDYENRYTRNGRYQPIYLAVSGKLFGMFVVSYRPDPDVADVLAQLAGSGLSVLVKSDDFSVTAPLIQRVYRMREGSVKVLSGEERRALAPATAYLPESEGCMTHLGSFASFVGGLQAAEGAASGERAAALVQAVSVVCSCLLALLLAFTGGLAGLALPALILYQAAWSALALAMPLLKKY